MVFKAAQVGANAIKFQLYDDKVIQQASEKWRKHLKKVQLHEGSAEALMVAGKKAGIEVFFTPMYVEAVDICEKLGVSRYKIRAKDAYDDDLLLAVRQTNKPCYVSRNCWPFKQRNFYTVHVDEERPTRFNQIEWYGCQPYLRHKKDVKCKRVNCYDTRHKDIVPSRLAMFYYDGYSCHCPKIYAPLTAMLYVDYIEVHVTLDTKDKTLPDWEYSFGFTDVFELCEFRDILNSRLLDNRPKFEIA